jgi:hypothetical protein
MAPRARASDRMVMTCAKPTTLVSRPCGRRRLGSRGTSLRSVAAGAPSAARLHPTRTRTGCCAGFRAFPSVHRPDTGRTQTGRATPPWPARARQRIQWVSPEFMWMACCRRSVIVARSRSRCRSLRSQPGASWARRTSRCCRREWRKTSLRPCPSACMSLRSNSRRLRSCSCGTLVITPIRARRFFARSFVRLGNRSGVSYENRAGDDGLLRFDPAVGSGA